MTTIALVKRSDGSLCPADEEAEAITKKFGQGEILKGEFKRWRNYRFHKKWFALVKFAFDLWCERGDGKPIEYKGLTALPNIDRFRKDITILCGFYEITVRVDGTTRVEAKSIAFENMEQDDFDKLYDKTIDVVLHKIIPQVRMTEAEFREAVNEAVGFV